MWENDIAKCDNKKCPLKEKCYRYTVKPDMMQTFLVDVKPNKNGYCEHYMEVDGHYDTDEI